MVPQNFGSVLINGEEFETEPGIVPPKFKDQWVASYGIKVTIPNKESFEAMVKGINECKPSLIQYPRGDLPLSECLNHRAVVERVEVLDAPPYKGRPKKQEIKVNLVYTLWIAGEA